MLKNDNELFSMEYHTMIEGTVLSLSRSESIESRIAALEVVIQYLKTVEEINQQGRTIPSDCINHIHEDKGQLTIVWENPKSYVHYRKEAEKAWHFLAGAWLKHYVAEPFLHFMGEVELGKNNA